MAAWTVAPGRLQEAKAVALDLNQQLDSAADDDLAEVLSKRTTPDYRWRAVHPFNELEGVEPVVERFWRPLRQAMAPLQRRPQVFIAGSNDVAHDETAGDEVWVLGMGHFLGLFQRPWLDIPPTGRMMFLRYAEFHRIDDGRVAETALFTDIIDVMAQAGHDPLPPQTGAAFVHPGPMTGRGVLLDPSDPAEGPTTMALVNRMIDDLVELNERANTTGDDTCPPEVLARTWHDDMIWYGPAGIGSSYTIDAYQQQHQYPFRVNLTDKMFNGHVARFAEGHYAGFFGWPNLTNTPTGGFLGLPGTERPADMRVVDVYRREGDKLAENWVFIDLLHYLSMQGLDVLGRMRQLLGIESVAPNAATGPTDGPDQPSDQLGV